MAKKKNKGLSWAQREKLEKEMEKTGLIKPITEEEFDETLKKVLKPHKKA